MSGDPSSPPPLAEFTIVPEVPVLLPRSTPPETSAQFGPTATPRAAQVEVSCLKILGLEPGTAKIFAAMLLAGRFCIHLGVSIHCDSRLLECVAMGSEEKKPKIL